MKILLVAFAVLAAAGQMEAKVVIPNHGNSDLYKDLQEFLDLLPVEDIVGVVMQYVAEDEEFQKVVVYMQSKEFQQLAKEVEELPEIVNLMNYIQKAGVDVYYLVNKLNKFIGLDPVVPPKDLLLLTAKGGLRGFVDDVKALLPLKEIEALFEHKLKTSKAFKDFIDQLSSPEFQKIVDTVYANPKFQTLLTKAKNAGIDVAVIKDLLFSILGIKVPAKPSSFGLY